MPLPYRVVRAHIERVQDVLVVGGRTAGLTSPLCFEPDGDFASGLDDAEHSMHDRFAAHDPCRYLIRCDGYVSDRSRRLGSREGYLADLPSGLRPSGLTRAST